MEVPAAATMYREAKQLLSQDGGIHVGPPLPGGESKHCDVIHVYCRVAGRASVFKRHLLLPASAPLSSVKQYINNDRTPGNNISITQEFVRDEHGYILDSKMLSLPLSTLSRNCCLRLDYTHNDEEAVLSMSVVHETGETVKKGVGNIFNRVFGHGDDDVGNTRTVIVNTSPVTSDTASGSDDIQQQQRK